MGTLNLDDINLDLDPEEERKLLEEAIEDDAKEEGEGEEEDKPAEEEEETEEEEAEEVEEPEAEEAEEPAKEPAKPDPLTAVLDELRAERQRLQEQLNELSVSSALTKKQLSDIEARRKAEEVVEPEGPTADEILHELDSRIAQTDAALTKAEEEDPASAPVLRRQLRQLERYYNDFKTQVQMQAAQPVDPDILVQEAAAEAQHQARFSATKRAVVAEYPMLDTSSDKFDPKLRDAIHRIYNPLIREGADPTEALIEATTLVMRANGVYSSSELAQLQQEEVARKAAEAAAKPAPVKSARKKEAVARNLEASEAIAPNLATAGKSNDASGILGKYDFGKMSIQEMMRINDDEEERIVAALSLYNERAA